MKQQLLVGLQLGLCCASLALASCASTAKGVKHSVFDSQLPVTLEDRSVSQADANVVIRYPAMVDRNAEAAFFDAFAAHPIGGNIKELNPNSDRVAESVIAKSNYFAMSLYRELQAILPENSVLLSPHYIYLEDEGGISSKPLLGAEEIPAVLTIDFSVYSFPDTEQMMNAPPQTFGDLITPLFVIHSNRWLMPATNGLLLSSDPLTGTAWNQSVTQAEAQFESRLAMQPVHHQRPLDFISYLRNGSSTTGKLPMKPAGNGTRAGVMAVEIYPLEKIQMQRELMLRLEQDERIDPFAEDFIKGAATRVVAALNAVDHDRATFLTRQSALATFDPELAHVFLMRASDESVRARIQLGEALLAAQRKFLARQARSVYEGTYEGTYGDEMRRMIAAEFHLLEDRRELARQQNISTALAIVAMAGAVYAGSQAGDSGNWGSYNNWRFLTDALALSSIWAVNVAMNKHAESKTVGENFLVQMAPALNEQASVQVELLEANEEITARTFAEFKSQTMEMYQVYARSMNVAQGPACHFLHPAATRPGTWFGNCENSVAEGLGYGLVRDDEGAAIEYLGSVHSGLPHGLGAMMVRPLGGPGTIYYEGQFADGLPDGIVRLEQPERRIETRKFSKGRDIGPADDQQLSAISFN